MNIAGPVSGLSKTTDNREDFPEMNSTYLDMGKPMKKGETITENG
jgi:hypothetical protein